MYILKFYYNLLLYFVVIFLTLLYFFCLSLKYIDIIVWIFFSYVLMSVSMVSCFLVVVFIAGRFFLKLFCDISFWFLFS